MSNSKIIVIDDQEIMRESLETALTDCGYSVDSFAEGADALERVRRVSPDLVITDIRMPGMDGMEVLRNVKEADATISVIVITAYGTVENAVEAMKAGAEDYIMKPFKVEEIEIVVNRALENRNLRSENRMLKDVLRDYAGTAEMVGNDASMKRLYEQITRIADSESTVLIRGESGTGKELVARAVHYQGNRADEPFVRVNCAALSAGLLESELFGHEKGAFTGADKQRVGRFEVAGKGTILLDEVSEIDMNLQAKLLRVLQEREFERVGSNEVKSVFARVIATTNRDLEKMVSDGNFRHDLYYRLNVVPLQIPPLRERKKDIPLLVDFFLAKYYAKIGKDAEKPDKKAMKLLTEYSWPGNVRELENIIERSVVLYPGEALSTDYLSTVLGGASVRRQAVGEEYETGKPLKDIEKDYILKTLEAMGGNRTQTARVLEIAERTLRDKLNKWKKNDEQAIGI